MDLSIKNNKMNCHCELVPESFLKNDKTLKQVQGDNQEIKSLWRI